MIIAIDFDGTIVENKFPQIGALKPHAKEVINHLHDRLGAKIIIWSCRTLRPELNAATDFLKKNGIRYDAINVNYFIPFPNHPKVYADIYIDDRQAGGLPNDWHDILKLIEPQMQYIKKETENGNQYKH